MQPSRSQTDPQVPGEATATVEPSLRSEGSADQERPDRALIEGCLRGDEECWRVLVQRYSRLVYSIPYRYGLKPEAAEDVFQAVFEACLRQLPRVRDHQALPKWFITTAHRMCRRAVRDDRERAAGRVEPPDEPDPPMAQMEQWERRHRVQVALRRLGGRCEDLLRILYSNDSGTAYDRAAEQLQMPRGSIGPTRARCLKKLLDILSAMERGNNNG